MINYDKDTELWQAWKTNPSQENLTALVAQMSPVIRKAAAQGTGVLPMGIVEAEAKLQAKKAFESYNPAMGVKLSTHLTNQLKKVNRMTYAHQEIYSVPEHRRLKHNVFSSGMDYLRDFLGRDPNHDELSEHLGWSKPEVGRFQSESFKELSDAQPHMSDASFHNTRDDSMVAYIYNDLNPKHKLVFEHTTGYNNKKVLSNTEIAKRARLKPHQVSYIKASLKDKFNDAYGEFG